MANKYCANCNDYIGLANYQAHRFCSDHCRKEFFKKFNKPVKVEYDAIKSKKSRARWKRRNKQ